MLSLMRQRTRCAIGVSSSSVFPPVVASRTGLRCRVQLLSSPASVQRAAASSSLLSSSPATAASSSDDTKLSRASVEQPPIASQVNGAKHGSTIYAPDTAALDAFRVRKTHEYVVKLWGDASSASASDDDAAAGNKSGHGSPAARVTALLQRSTERSVEFLWDLFLPKDATSSVTRDYFPYAKWYFVASIASSAAGVLSMQSLLYAIGLGAGSIPTAAAVNWVLKDGLGQFGGVMFASLVNNRYDADPKRWRTASSVALDAAVLVEILTPLAPAYFLPMASLANVAKNISWLSASATRAGFHNSFAKRENLADVTAKAGSQAIASSILGTGLGIGLSQLTGASTPHVLAAFAVLSAVHIASIYRSLASVALRTLNCQRLHLVARHFIDSGGVRVPSLETVSAQEQFMPLLISGYRSLYRRSFVHGEASLDALSGSSPRELLRLKAFYARERYLLRVTRLGADVARVDLALADDATSHDALFAHLHAALVQRTFESDGGGDADSDGDGTDNATDWRVVERAYSESLALRDAFVEQLEASEWHTENLLVEEQNSRFKWLE